MKRTKMGFFFSDSRAFLLPAGGGSPAIYAAIDPRFCRCLANLAMHHCAFLSRQNAR